MELDRQNIEKRDFPIGRRGYDPAAVDAHLRMLASEIEELQRALAGPGPDSLAVSAGTQVQSIVAAAESAAAEIESQALASAHDTREQARSDAEKTRSEAVAQAQAHVAAVARATATLLARVESMDGQVSALVENLRGGATRLAGDLAAVDTNMGELYDAAAGRRSAASLEPGAVAGSSASAGEQGGVTPRAPAPPVPDTPVPAPPARAPGLAGSNPAADSGAPGAAPPGVAGAAAPPQASPASAAAAPPPLLDPASSKTPAPGDTPADASVEQTQAEPGAMRRNGEGAGSSEYDARLVALNMALNGESREDTDRYIAENYEVDDRKRLLDEVFAAIES